MKFLIWREGGKWGLVADRCPLALHTKRRRVLKLLNTLMKDAERQKPHERRNDDQTGTKGGKGPAF